MTSYVWETGDSGDWGVAANWIATPGGFPNASTATVTINAAGTYTVTISGGESYTANTVTLDSSGAVLAVDGVLTLAGTAPALTVTEGEFDLYGELVGGTVTAGAGGMLVIENDATLDGVTWQAPLTFGYNNNLYVTGGLTVETASGGTPGSIDMTAGSDALFVEDSETLNNATLNFGSNGNDYISIYNSCLTVTFGSGFTLEQSGGTNYLNSGIYDDYTGTIANAGKINVSGGDLAVASVSFTNSGSITISGGGTVDLSAATTSTNTGLFSIGTGSELVLGRGFSNTGSITIANGGTLEVDGLVTLAGLEAGTITNGGGTLQVDISGTLDLGGGTMDVAATGLFSNTIIYGTLSDGTVSLDGGTLTLASGATLDPITFLGALTFIADQSLNIVGGLTVETTSGGFPGIVDMTAGGDTLNVDVAETLNNMTVEFGSLGGDHLTNDYKIDAGQTLTLGSGFSLTQSGGTSYLDNYYVLDSIVNDGSIGVTGGDLLVQAGTFTNSGSIAISGGGTVDLSDPTLSNTGQISIGAGSELVLGSGFSNTCSITIASGGTLVLPGTLSELAGVTNSGGTVVVAGALVLGSGTMDIATTGLFSNTVIYGELIDGTVKLAGGNLTLENGATLDLITFLGALTFTADQTLNIFNGLTVETTSGGFPGLIDMTAGDDTLYLVKGETLDNATLNFGSVGGDYLSVGYYADADTLTLGSGFTIEQSGGANNLYNYQVYGGGLIVNDGKIDVSGGDLVVSGNGFTNSGSISINGGYVDIGTTQFISTGSIIIGDGGTFEIAPATAANITYNDPANLILDIPSGYTGTLSGMVTGDTLQLDGENIASAGIAGTTLTVHLNGGGTLTYKTGPGLNGITFSVSQGTDGLVRDLLTVLCFLPGTLIATPLGETPVERLAVGDMVRSASGWARPIAWIGNGKVLATRGRRNAATPVVVSKGALGPNVPHHDLRVTKGHSIYLDGALIPVEFLVNHRSIYWDDRAQEATLYHIELETHDVLLANGAPAESYRDDGNRWLFQNANSGWHLPPKPPCAPVLTGGPVVDAAWRRLADRAGPCPCLPITDDPDLHLLVDGRRIDPIWVCGALHHFRLPAQPGTVRIASRAGVPQELGTARDPRPLGVALRQIIVSQGEQVRRIEAGSPMLTEGFHAYEPADAIRWTDGDAAVPASLFDGFSAPHELVLRLGGATSYVAEGRVAARSLTVQARRGP